MRVARSSRSSTARAAYPRQACTSAAVSCGYSAMISVLSPLATRPTIVGDEDAGTGYAVQRSALPIPMQNPALLPLYQLDPEVLERLAAKVVSRRNNLATHFFGRRGQKQYGLDIVEFETGLACSLYQVKLRDRGSGRGRKGDAVRVLPDQGCAGVGACCRGRSLPGRGRPRSRGHPGRGAAGALRTAGLSVRSGRGRGHEADHGTDPRDSGVDGRVVPDFDRQCEELAALLAAEDTSDTNGLTAQVVAAQTIGVLLRLKSRFYGHLVAGEPAGLASRRFADEVNIAFALLKAGIGDRYRKQET
jgi:hypothetical protein